MHKEENEVNTKISVLDFSAQEESQAEETQIFLLFIFAVSVWLPEPIAYTYPYINFS